jgi:pimeloyl-ACP methyl ester carboxylesterase
LIAEASVRVQAGIDYLHGQGFKEVVVVAHSMGTVMASYYLAESGEKIVGYVAIGMPEGNSQHLANIDLPLLDLYGSDDLPTVLGSSEARAKASVTNKFYKQKRGKDADHFFEGKDDVLLEIVSSWLEGISK